MMHWSGFTTNTALALYDSEAAFRLSCDNVIFNKGVGNRATKTCACEQLVCLLTICRLGGTELLIVWQWNTGMVSPDINTVSSGYLLWFILTTFRPGVSSESATNYVLKKSSSSSTTTATTTPASP